MLTEILIKPYLDDLERQGIEDTAPYEDGFMAGFAALSSLLSDEIDNQPMFFVYLGMAITEGSDWVERKIIEQEIADLKEHYQEPRERQPTPSSDFNQDNEDWDYIPTHSDISASIVKKYAKKNVLFSESPGSGEKIKEGRAILDLSASELQVIDMSGNQIKKPYYIKLK